MFIELRRHKRITADRETAFLSTKCRESLNENFVTPKCTRISRGSGQQQHLMRSLFNELCAVLNEKEENKWIKVLPGIEDHFSVSEKSIVGST